MKNHSRCYLFAQFLSIMITNFRHPIFDKIQAEATKTGTADWYETLPRFLNEAECRAAEQNPQPVERDIELNGEPFRLFILPASILDEADSLESGSSHYFPSERESLVESAIIELAAQASDNQPGGERKFTFSLGQLQNHLAARKLHFSREQIEHSMRILAGAAYVLVGKNTQWIFRTIETLAVADEDDGVKFLLISGYLLVERIRRRKRHRRSA